MLDGATVCWLQFRSNRRWGSCGSKTTPPDALGSADRSKQSCCDGVSFGLSCEGNGLRSPSQHPQPAKGSNYATATVPVPSVQEQAVGEQGRRGRHQAECNNTCSIENGGTRRRAKSHPVRILVCCAVCVCVCEALYAGVTV